jgi:SAM-dependent methyltransferase
MTKLETKENSYDIEWKVQSSHWWFVSRRRLLKSILSSINLPKKGIILDIGCGAGSNLSTLESTGLNVVGLDQSFYALSLVRKMSKLPLVTGDLNHLPIHSDSVGLIIASDILEHLEDDLIGINAFYRVLREGSILIVTVPAFRFLWGIQDIVTGHKRRYSKKEILRKLSQGGFQILRSSHFNFFLFFPILLARRVIRFFSLKIGSENTINSPLMNLFLKGIFSIEPFLLRHFSFPFGVSIYCIAQKVKRGVDFPEPN